MPLRSPVSSSSLLDKLFGSKQKSSYSPKSGKPDKANGIGVKGLPRPQLPLRALLSNASNVAQSSSGGGSLDDEGLGSGRKRSKSCSDSDELLAIDDQARVDQLPTLTKGHKLLNQPKQRASGAYQGEHSSASDEVTTRASVRNLRASPQPQHMAIPPAAPLSLQGRGRLENAFQEVLISPHAHAGQLRSRNRMRVGTISFCSTTRDETSSWRWSCST
jgi:hypothetical protein